MKKENSKLLGEHCDILSFRDLADSTVDTYVSYMKSFILWVEENLPAKDLSSLEWADIRTYVRFLKDVRSLNPRTINVHIAQLRDFYFYVLHKDWDNRQVPLLHFDEKLPIVPDRETVIRIINSIKNPKHRAEIVLLYSSGIRVSELCNLKCGDIIHSKNHIHIARGKNRSERFAVLSEKAYKHLAYYVWTTYRSAKPEDWLFPGQKPGTPISTQTVRNALHQNLERIGLDNCGYTPHSLRHAFGLHLYEAGTDLMTIKEALGHKSLSSTTVYLTLGIGNGRSVTSPYDFD